MSYDVLTEKWAPVIEHEDLPKVDERDKKAVLAQVLQNILLKRVKMGNIQQMGGFPPPTSTPKEKKSTPKNNDGWDHPIA